MKRVAAALFAVTSATAFASSHREAPGVAQDPSIDLTDVYAFPTPGDPTHVTLIMNVWPAGQSYAGPNWYQFADDAIYEMHVDYTGDAIEDVTYQFKFKTNNYRAAGGAIIANYPKIDFVGGKYTNCGLCQTYTVTKMLGRRRHPDSKNALATDVPVAPARIGPYTTDHGGADIAASSALLSDEKAMYLNYKALADKAVYNSGGYKFFAGPRLDPFFVDLGGIFDRIAIRIPGITGTPKDSLQYAQIMTMAMEVPLSDFNNSRYFGVWATVSKPQGQFRLSDGRTIKLGGAWTQVSRLGNPLVNEVVIKINDKDKFNNTEPKDDAKNYATYVTNPQLASVLNSLYGSAGTTAKGFITDIEDTNRTDLVAAFVTGLPGINKHPNATATGGDMLRVNLDFAIQEWPLSGRNLTDDVVKSSLIFLAQCTVLSGNTGSPANPFGKVAPPAAGASPPVPANCLLDDFITAKAKNPANAGAYPLPTFPYEDVPYSSYGKQN